MILIFLAAWTAVVWWYASYCGYSRAERDIEERFRTAEYARRLAAVAECVRRKIYDQDARP